MDVRPYDGDRDGLWALKRAFELELAELGGAEKEAAYSGKLTDAYRERYLEWVARCVDEEPGCVAVADGGDALVGYAFLFPESLAMIWDAAVLNELYVREDRRGTGVADDLLGAVVECAREQDLPLDRLVLDVAPDNERAVGFYARHGFEPWAEMLARPL